jgi:aspartokinase
MIEPISAAVVTALAAGQFVATELAKGTATEGGKQIAVTMWEKIKQRFQKDDRALEAITAVETEKSEEAVSDLTTYVKSEMKRYPEFAAEVQQLAQNIININQQAQEQTKITINARDNSNANLVQKLEHSGSGDVVLRDKVINNI